MLVKFGKMGKEVREYCVEDEMTIEEFLSDVADVDLDYDDVIHCSAYPDEEINEDNASDYNLEENATYILETVELSHREEALLDLIRRDSCIDDMSVKEQKEYVQRLVKHVLAAQWDN